MVLAPLTSCVLKGPGYFRILQSPGSLFSGMPQILLFKCGTHLMLNVIRVLKKNVLTFCLYEVFFCLYKVLPLANHLFDSI